LRGVALPRRGRQQATDREQRTRCNVKELGISNYNQVIGLLQQQQTAARLPQPLLQGGRAADHKPQQTDRQTSEAKTNDTQFRFQR